MMTHEGRRPRGQTTARKEVPRARRRESNGIVDGARQHRPRGREAVMTAVLAAATRLFAAHGPGSVSVRDIAAAAGVNHALIHLYFGSKQQVLRAVLERATVEIRTTLRDIADSQAGIARVFGAAIEHELYCRALARATLDGESPRALQRDFPNVRRLIELFEGERQQPRKRLRKHAPLPPPDARTVVGALSALVLGWVVFEPFLLTATGLDQHDREEVRNQVAQVLQLMIECTR